MQRSRSAGGGCTPLRGRAHHSGIVSLVRLAPVVASAALTPTALCAALTSAALTSAALTLAALSSTAALACSLRTGTATAGSRS